MAAAGDLMQRLNLGSLAQERATPWVRQLLAVGAIIRWVGLGVAGIIGVLAPPPAPSLLVALILTVGVYNAASMWLVRRVGDHSVLRLAQAITVLDELGCLAFLAIFTGLPGGTQIAFYVPMVVEAVAFGGVIGASQAVFVFSVGIVAVEWTQHALFNRTFSWAVVLLWILVMLVVSVSIAALDRTLLGAPLPGMNQVRLDAAGLPQAAGSNLQLSRREQEVLQLIAAGQSDAMIAARLHLSETTVKTHVGTLRTRLGARTRAEAVAIASRLNLLNADGGPSQA
jgi:DNA-binding CsgD family transcriptional regulator